MKIQLSDIEEGEPIKDHKSSTNKNRTSYSNSNNNTEHTSAAMTVQSGSGGGSKASSKKSQQMVVSLDRDTLNEILKHGTMLHDDDGDIREDDDDSNSNSMNGDRILWACGCCPCCDIRRFAIAANILYGFILLVMVIWVIQMVIKAEDEASLGTLDTGGLEEDEFWKIKLRARTMTHARNGTGIFVALVFGVGGAYRYNRYFVLVASVWCFVSVVWALLQKRHIGALGALVMIYPNVHLLWVLWTGKLTREKNNAARGGRRCRC